MQVFFFNFNFYLILLIFFLICMIKTSTFSQIDCIMFISFDIYLNMQLSSLYTVVLTL